MRWAGGDETFLDRPDATAVGRLMLGRYGGRGDAGASKNEDAALLIEGSDWELADGARLHADFYGGDLGEGVSRLMQAVHDGRGSDSATVVAWDVTGGDRPNQPSR